MSKKSIKNALISVFHKDGLDPIVKKLDDLGVTIYSTGGTYDFIQKQGISVKQVESLTKYPAIFGGRVKTLHPMIFGGILNRRNTIEDQKEKEMHNIPDFDLVIVDLYPFEKTVADPNSSESDIIEKIDIGGISLIRAAAKNYEDVLVVPSVDQYTNLLSLLEETGVDSTIEQRKYFAKHAFNISSHYDAAIFQYLNRDFEVDAFKVDQMEKTSLRYGENPHQKGTFYGNLEKYFNQIHGKEISYNNLVDIEAAIQLISEFENGNTTFGILKHNNACGLAQGDSVVQAYEKALESDPISAFGGILVSNRTIDSYAAEKINGLFFEVIIAPGYEDDALTILKSKKNRIILNLTEFFNERVQYKSLLGGAIVQDYNEKTDAEKDLKSMTDRLPTDDEIGELLFASKICKHTKSNTIVLTKGKQMLASGVGQTSRVDALEQAIAKAKKFKFDLKGAVMASDAFFPFPDCVEIASKEDISAVIQPGGSVKDQLSIDECNRNGMTMVFTGHRHFKH